MPGERLEKGIQNVYILGEDEGLILRANETFAEGVGSLLFQSLHNFIHSNSAAILLLLIPYFYQYQQILQIQH